VALVLDRRVLAVIYVPGHRGRRHIARAMGRVNLRFWTIAFYSSILGQKICHGLQSLSTTSISVSSRSAGRRGNRSRRGLCRNIGNRGEGLSWRRGWTPVFFAAPSGKYLVKLVSIDRERPLLNTTTWVGRPCSSAPRGKRGRLCNERRRRRRARRPIGRDSRHRARLNWSGPQSRRSCTITSCRRPKFASIRTLRPY